MPAWSNFDWFPRYQAPDSRATLLTVGVAMLKIEPRKSLVNQRSLAFSDQNGYCYYCRQPMWNKNALELTSKYRITAKQATLLRCTGEHLVARKDGGSAARCNIVAACKFCNEHRHRRQDDIAPPKYLQSSSTSPKPGTLAWPQIEVLMADCGGC